MRFIRNDKKDNWLYMTNEEWIEELVSCYHHEIGKYNEMHG
jgi:hypothetical protein